MATVSWVTSETGHRCTRHGKSFPRGEVCRECVDDPGPPPQTIESAAAGPLPDRIAALREKAQQLWDYYVDRIDGDDAGLAIKAVAEHTKIIRLAEELEDRVESRAHDLTLIEHERAMAGLRRAN